MQRSAGAMKGNSRRYRGHFLFCQGWEAGAASPRMATIPTRELALGNDSCGAFLSLKNERYPKPIGFPFGERKSHIFPTLGSVGEQFLMATVGTRHALSILCGTQNHCTCASPQKRYFFNLLAVTSSASALSVRIYKVSDRCQNGAFGIKLQRFDSEGLLIFRIVPKK
jgi:hypothetical protein